MEVPYHGDPYAPDLVTQYWPDVRRLVAARLADGPRTGRGGATYGG